MIEVTIIIPARNEEDVIEKTLERLRRKVTIPHKIIVVNDCSDDKTEQIVRVYAKRRKNITIVNNSKRTQGFSQVLKLGFKNSKTKYAVPVMADLCDNPITIAKMFRLMKGGYDIVCGSRYIKGGKKKGGPFLQGFLSNVLNKFMHLIGFPTTDITNAFKMYRVKSLANIGFTKRGGVEASMENTMQIYFKGGSMIDVATEWRGRTIGSSKFKIIQRTPRYFKASLWGLKNRIRESLNLRLIKFYAKY